MPEFLSGLREKRYAAPEIPFLSSCDGAYMAGPFDWPAYFVRQMREPVRFFQAVKAAREDIFLEIGAGPTLTSFGRQIRRDVQWLFVQNGSSPGGAGPENSARDALAQERPLAFALAKLYTLGLTPDFSRLWTEPWRPENAPTPAFLRKRPVADAMPRPTRAEPPEGAGKAATRLELLIREQEAALAAVREMQKKALRSGLR
jgi:acyl transferase domain-containing protein